MADPAPLANIVVPANLSPETVIMMTVFGFPAPGTAIANPTIEDYTNAEYLLKRSNSIPAADQAAVKQFCGDVMLTMHQAALVPMAAKIDALAAKVDALADKVDGLAAYQGPIAAMLAHQIANDKRRVNVLMTVTGDLLELPCEKIQVGLAEGIEPPSGLFG